MLVSRDEQSCLVVTYAQVKQCMEGAVQYVFFLANCDASCDKEADEQIGTYHEHVERPFPPNGNEDDQESASPSPLSHPAPSSLTSPRVPVPQC